MGTNLIRAMLLASGSASIAVAAFPAAAYAQEASYQIDIPAQSLGDALRALGRATKQNIVFEGAVARGKRSTAVRGRLSAGEALQQMLSGSGLVMTRSSGGALTVRAGNFSGPGRVDAPAATAQLTVSAPQSSVVDARTGAALKGALVEIIETGDQTSTGNLGEFRFPGKSGSYNLRFSYLGYPQYEQYVELKDGRANVGILLSDGSATNEILVTAYQSARAQALNQERTAENSTTIISGDLLGNFNGSTISDALRRAPGVAFQQDDRTGDGTNIIVRGLSPDYNQVRLNGVSLPDGSGVGRSPNLNNLLSDSVSEIKISKTLLASQESSGTGGLVEIETKSPLDRPRRYFNVSVDGTQRAKGFGHEYSASGTASFRFGANENFGVSASVQYRRQKNASYSYSVQGIFGAYLPLLPNGQPAAPFSIDPRTPFPFYNGAEYLVRSASISANETESETQNVSISAEWQASPGTNLRLDYVRSKRTDDIFENRYDVGMVRSSYTLRPVPGLDGESRYVFFDRAQTVYPNSVVTYRPGEESNTDTISFRGTSEVGKLSVRYGLGYAKGSSYAPLYASQVLSAFPGTPVDSTTFLPEAINPVTGTIVSYFGPRRGRNIPSPLLTEAGFDSLLNSPLPLLSGYYSSTDARGSTRNWSSDLSGKYEFNGGILKYLEAGVSYRKSTSGNVPVGTLAYDPVYDATGYPVPLEDVGIEFDNLPFSTQSGDNIYKLPTKASILGFFGRLDEYAQSGFLTRSESLPESIYADQSTAEEQLVGFAQARIDFGNFQFIPGVRIERARVSSAYANGVQIYDAEGVLDQDFFNATRVIESGRSTNMTYLPRVLLNYRPSQDIVMRLGYYSTESRPQIQQLTSEAFLYFDERPFFGPTSSQPLLSVQMGNPGLKPARTHNFDFGAEWYDGNIGVVKFNIFYKQINNLLESNSLAGRASIEGVALPDHPKLNNLPSDIHIEFVQPLNNPDPAKIWGFEAAVERRLAFLPGLFAGLGIYANYTYSNGSKTQPFTFSAPVYDASGNITDFENVTYQRRLDFLQSPRHSGTVGLTYGKGGLDASLFYTAQARRLAGPEDFGMDRYSEAVSSLDFRAVYGFDLAGANVRISFEGLNLLKGASDPNTEQSIGGGDFPKYYTSGNFLGGRKFALGLSATF